MAADRTKYQRALHGQQLEQRVAAGETPDPRRITQALDMAGLDGPAVDVALGGVEPMVDEWEDGTTVPTFEQVVRLAELTGMVPEWFYLPYQPIGPVWVCRRGRGGGCIQVDDSRPEPRGPAQLHLF